MEPISTFQSVWTWIGGEIAAFGFRWIIVLSIMLGFGGFLGWRYRAIRAEIDALKASGTTPSVSNVVTLNIGKSEHYAFTNLIDVVGALDMTPLGPEGAKVGALPNGSNLVTFPDGTVQLALPTAAISWSATAGTPKAWFQISSEQVGATDENKNA